MRAVAHVISPWRWGRLPLSGLVLLLACLVGLGVAVSGAGTGIEQSIRSAGDSIRQHTASGDNVLVEIDARSLAAVDHWPWPRGLYAEALSMLQRASASTVAFDIDLSSRSTPSQDRALADAIDRATVPVVLPTFRQYGSLAGGGTIENLPIPELRQHAQLAAVNISADDDGLVRRYFYGVTTDGVPRPSIGALLAGSAGRAGASFVIDGSIDPDSIPRISFVDLLRGRVPARSLRGKSVLIGATAIELGDRFAVPRYGVIPGPVIQLLAAETLTGGSSLIDYGPILPLIAALAVLAIAARVSGWLRAAAIGAGLIILAAVPLALETARLGTAEIIPALAALATGAAVFIRVSIVAALSNARLIDPASGLPNRRGFQRRARSTPVASVTALRIANYSDAAALIGQERAAEMIKRVVDRLAVSGVDNPCRLEDGVIAWTGADGLDDDLISQIEGVAALLRTPVEVGGRNVELRCRFGLAIGADVSPDVLADRAIMAADHAVERGTRWEMHDEALGQAQDWRLALAGELDQALAAGDIWVAYQPKLDIARRRIVAAEALVRWRHPERGAIPPDAFIPALESSGRILDLTLFVLHQAARDAADWQNAGATINVAVNVSALLTADEYFLAAVDNLLERGVVTPDMLTLEVTESATLADPAQAIVALEAIAARGIKLSIDDYGTGQSTLSYLKRLPAREIKIDKSFVLGLETSRSDQAMVRSTIELAHELGYAVVAEGVETAGVLAVLAGMGCDTAQGWHIGKPVAAGEFFDAVCGVRAAA